METKSMPQLIIERMQETAYCTIYTNSDFIDLGNQQVIKKALSRLVNNNKVHRILDGFYTIPFYSKVIEEYSYPTVDQLANKIAEKFSWNISLSGESTLNLLGISTQVSNNYEYISDGPYREYEYRGNTITFKHTSNRTISSFSKELSILIQGIKILGEQNITNDVIMRLSIYCRKHIKEDIVKDTKQIPSWIYEVLRKISEVNHE